LDCTPQLFGRAFARQLPRLIAGCVQKVAQLLGARDPRTRGHLPAWTEIEMIGLRSVSLPFLPAD
jgi:hypothetical protein